MGRQGSDPTTRTPAMRFARMVGRLDYARRAVEQHARLKRADQRLMWLFSDGRPRTLREVSEALSLEQSTVNRQVNRAVASGLLERSGPRSGGARVLTATDEGLARFTHDRELHLRVFDRTLEVLDPETREDFLETLDRVVQAYVDTVADAPWTEQPARDP